ncbi:MAG TPA: DNA-3-methyladenine glycosylase 2 family protein [Actinomycetota bacterium]|nr:DNA-3-methyladenine glycosylase 2 family protein [Actinomycetota bacterium]
MPRTSLQTAVAQVAASDPVMGAFIELAGPMKLRASRGVDVFTALASSILYQQLAGAAASAIHARFLALFDGHPTAEAVKRARIDRLRKVGLSGNKAAAIKDLAAKVLDGTVPTDGWGRLSDDEIVERLTAVRGIGRWTVEMFLIFDLGRLDVWPVDDYGVRKGWSKIHGLPELLKPKALMAEGERFRPHRTVAAWYCWRAVDIE